jgi:hypothetical protein
LCAKSTVPDPDPHGSASFWEAGVMEGRGRSQFMLCGSKWSCGRFEDHHFFEKQDPDPHQPDSNPQDFKTFKISSESTDFGFKKTSTFFVYFLY